MTILYLASFAEIIFRNDIYLKVKENQTLFDVNPSFINLEGCQARRFETNVHGDGWKVDMNAVLWQEIREMRNPHVEVIAPTKSFFLHFYSKY